jgi:hypothetical protein
MAIQSAFSSEPNPEVYKALAVSDEEGEAAYNTARARASSVQNSSYRMN